MNPLNARGEFAEICRNWNIPFVAVSEMQRDLFAQAEIGEFDYMVTPGHGKTNLLVLIRDGITAVTQQDVLEMLEWEKVFGKGFEAVLVFDAYNTYSWISVCDWIRGVRLSRPLDQLLQPAMQTTETQEAVQ